MMSSIKSLFDNSSHTRSLVVLHDSLVQSAVPVVREIIARDLHSDSSTHVILVAAQRRPSIYLPVTTQDGGKHITVFDGSRWVSDFSVDGGTSSSSEASRAFGSAADLLDLVLPALNAKNNSERVTVVIDSLDGLAARTSVQRSIREVTHLVGQLLGALNGFSRLIVGLRQSNPSPRSAGLLEGITSPLIWRTGNASNARADSGRGSTTIIRIHPPALIAHVHRTYGLRPPSTSPHVAASLKSEHDSVIRSPGSSSSGLRPTIRDHTTTLSAEITAQANSQPKSSTRPQDVKFWEILSLLAVHGDTSLTYGNVANAELGWWTQDRLRGSTGLIDALGSPCTSRGEGDDDRAVSLLDLVGSKSSDSSRRTGRESSQPTSSGSAGPGLAMLEMRHRTPQGKLEEEVLACVCQRSGRLRLHALDMADTDLPPKPAIPVSQASGLALPRSAEAARHPASSASHPPPTTSSSSPALSFNLTETEQQRARRSEVPLPYAHMQSQEPIMFDQGRMGQVADAGPPSLGGARRGHIGNSTILFQPESDDDEDDEDPDDDLDF